MLKNIIWYSMQFAILKQLLAHKLIGKSEYNAIKKVDERL